MRRDATIVLRLLATTEGGRSVEGVDSLYEVAEHGALASRERGRQMDDLRIACSEDSDASVIDNLRGRARRSPSLTVGEMAEMRQ